MIAGPDRLKLMLAAGQDAVTGLDFVRVHASQTVLDVHFLLDPASLSDSLVGDLAADRVEIHSLENDAEDQRVEVSVTAVSWTVVDGRNVLRLQTAAPGGFALHRLRIDDARLDPYFDELEFSFKAGCPGDLDCEPGPHACPPDSPIDFPVDYLARDFNSFRKALLDFASLRYPGWEDRLEADYGVMLAEVMSALGDELAFYQDRIAREAHLETASQRRSLRSLARLVDTEVRDGLAATAWIDITAAAGMSGDVPAGADVHAVSDAGKQVRFEIGRGLSEVADGIAYAVDSARNSFLPHIWDEDDACLPVGATEIHLSGAREAVLPLDDVPAGKAPGRWMLLKTEPEEAGRPRRRHMVRVIQVEELDDPLVNITVTRLAWEKEQALPFEMDLGVLEVRGNLLPATAGTTFPHAGEATPFRFVVGRDPRDLAVPEAEQATLTRAIERVGIGGAPVYRFSLHGSDETPLTWLGGAPETALPEVLLREVAWDGTGWIEVRTWESRRSFLGTNSSQSYDHHYVLEDGTWRNVVNYRRPTGTIPHADYASGRGRTLRFGEGEFGLLPAAGTVFEVTYRLGNGRDTNVGAEALTRFDAAGMPMAESVMNPLPASGGLDPETAAETRQTAPEAFRAVTYRAVRPEDYAEAAERLDWVQKAGARFRWTGSWLGGMVTPDPVDAVVVSEAQRIALQRQMDRFRQAGQDVYAADPRYADLDLKIHVCVEPTSYAGHVKREVLKALLDPGGFFDPDAFTFGAPLWRSRLEAAVQAAPGVRAVERIEIKRRGYFDWRDFDEAYYAVGDDEVVRLENDRDHPERGTLRLVMEGGA